MKLNRILAVLVAMAMLLAAPAALAQSTITVQGVGNVKVKSDRAGICLGVRETDTELAAAQTRVNEKIAAIIEALNKAEMTVAVQAGTTGEAWVLENLPNAKVVPLASVTVCMTGVSTGQYQAFCADLPVIGHQCTVSFTDCQIALEIPTGEQYGIVVSKDNPGLTAAINQALADMEADGTMASLKEKWFGV